jgi:hypothetical protein
MNDDPTDTNLALPTPKGELAAGRPSNAALLVAVSSYARTKSRIFKICLFSASLASPCFFVNTPSQLPSDHTERDYSRAGTNSFSPVALCSFSDSTGLQTLPTVNLFFGGLYTQLSCHFAFY